MWLLELCFLACQSHLSELRLLVSTSAVICFAALAAITTLMLQITSRSMSAFCLQDCACPELDGFALQVCAATTSMWAQPSTG